MPDPTPYVGRHRAPSTAPPAEDPPATTSTHPAAPAPHGADGGDTARSTSGRQPQPVLNAAAVQTVLAALVTVGWVQLDDAVVASLATVIAAMIGGAVTWFTRAKVTPMASPRDEAGRPLR